MFCAKQAREAVRQQHFPWRRQSPTRSSEEVENWLWLSRTHGQGKPLQRSDAAPFLHPCLGQHPWLEAQEHARTQLGQIKHAVLKPSCLLRTEA